MSAKIAFFETSQNFFMNQLLESIYRFKSINSINLLGITTAHPFENTRLAIEATHDKLLGFTVRDIERRIFPQLALPSVKSIIVIGVNYNKKIPPLSDDRARGIMSQMSIGVDYHFHLKNILRELVFCLLRIENFEYRVFVDTGPLVDKSIAHRAGLGEFGKNNCLISKKFGSFFNIGYILSSIDFSGYYINNSIYLDICGKCNKCLNACPTGAISSDNIFDPFKCISFLTQTKRNLSDIQRLQMSPHIYGCDICQTVCPYNQKITPTKSVSLDEAYPLIDDIINITDNEFTEKYSHTACGWLGKSKLQQNAFTVASHTEAGGNK